MAIKYTPTPLPEQQRLRFNVDAFYGINKLGKANSGEFVDCKNMSSDKYPYASPRPPREVIAEGITNPQKLLFCGDKLSYIAEGKLNVSSGEGFDSIGDVGTVSTAVDFNNTKMLFYPTNCVYDYEKCEISDISQSLTLIKGSFTQDNEFSSECDNVYLRYNGASYEYIKAATYVIKYDEDDYYIYPGDTGEVDDDGNKIYTTVTINVSGNNSSYTTSGTPKRLEYGMRLFVHAWYGDELLTTSGGYDIKYWEFDFGEPIVINGKTPSKILVQVGYFYKPNQDYFNYLCKDECIAQRDADLENTDFKLWITSTEYPAPNSVPAIAYACMDNNRVVAVEGNNFYASSLGDYADWTDFIDADGNPKETGAYAEELYTYGDFTGIIKYNNNVVLTKADLTYICYGNKPPYRINEICKSGCISGDTLAEVGGYLYWLGREGVYRFGGGIPQVISSKIGSGFTDGVACGNGHKYYICLGNGTDYRLYVYDTRYGLWHIEDERRYISLVSKEGSVYGLTEDGEILKFNSGDERVEWEFTTTDYDFGTEYTKNIAKVYCRLKLYGQSYVDVYIRTNKQPWYKFANFKAEGISVFQAKAKLKKFDYFTLRFVGRGKAEIMDIYADIFVGSQKHRSGDNLTVFK